MKRILALLKKPLGTNWKTTIAGILSFLVSVGHELVTLLDDDPLTMPNWSIVIAALMVLLGLGVAQDAKKEVK